VSEDNYAALRAALRKPMFSPCNTEGVKCPAIFRELLADLDAQSPVVEPLMVATVEDGMMTAVAIEPDSTEVARLKEELLQRDIIITAVRDAINKKGYMPFYHDSVMKRHRREWPALWKALDRLVAKHA
jgi:hypothetical protein